MNYLKKQLTLAIALLLFTGSLNADELNGKTVEYFEGMEFCEIFDASRKLQLKSPLDKPVLTGERVLKVYEENGVFSIYRMRNDVVLENYTFNAKNQLVSFRMNDVHCIYMGDEEPEPFSNRRVCFNDSTSIDYEDSFIIYSGDLVSKVITVDSDSQFRFFKIFDWDNDEVQTFSLEGDLLHRESLRESIRRELPSCGH